MRVLIVRLGAFGDIIHTLPLAADLHAAGHHLGWVCEDRWAVLLERNPAIAQVHRWPRKTLKTAAYAQRWRVLRRLCRELRSARYDVVIDAQGLAKSHALALASGAQRIAHRRPRARELSWLAPAVRVPIDAVHVIDQQRALGLPLLGTSRAGGWRFPLPDWSPEQQCMRAWLADHSLRNPWLLNVGAGWPTKVWPSERLRGFAAACRSAAIPLLAVWGSPAEQEIAQQLCAEGAILAPPTTIPELGGLLTQGAVLISGDTGPLHLALALDTPAVGLFGPVPATRNGPRGAAYACLQAPGAAWERRDVSKVDMGAITVDAVMDAARRIARHP